MTPGLRSPCIDCGELTSSTRCGTCKPPKRPSAGTYRRPKGDKTYGPAWQRLRKQALRIQNYCSFAHLGGCSGELQLDHSPRAHDRAAAGLPVRLEDTMVVCGKHNVMLGPARGADVNRPYAPDYQQLG